MTHFMCAHVSRHLAAFHDRELSIEQQIAIESHLQDCASCAAEAVGLQAVGDTLRAEAAGLAQDSFADLEGFRASVMSRIKAEREESWPSRIRRLFDDLHFVYAGLGAAGATLACLVVMLGLMHFGARERPDSLAALVDVLAAPSMPGTAVMADGQLVTLPAGAFRDDGQGAAAVFALSNVVTDQGRLRTLDSTHIDTVRNQDAREEILNLMDTIIETQFQPEYLDRTSYWSLHVTVYPRASASASRVSKQSAGAFLHDHGAPLTAAT